MVSEVSGTSLRLCAGGTPTWGEVSKAREQKECGVAEERQKEEQEQTEKHFSLQLIDIKLHTCLDSKMTKI